MSKVIELRRQRAAVLDQADAILSAAAAEERALTDDETGKVEGLKAQAERIQKQETLAESVEDMRSQAAQPIEQRTAPAQLRGARGDNEPNAWKAYLQHGDRGGLRHYIQPGDEGSRPQIVLNLPTQRATRQMIEERAVTDSTMNITTAGDGKNLVPTPLVSRIAFRKNEMMLADRLGCQPVPGVGTTVSFPYESADPDVFGTTSEQSDAHGNNYERAAFQTALKAFTLVKFSRKVELTEEMLEDSGVDLMNFIADKIAREIAVTHNTALVAEVEANGTSLKSFTSNSAIAAGELEAILGNDTLGFYLENASSVHWVMRSSTHWAINAITADSRFYSAQMAGLLGYDVLYSNKVDAIGASGKSVLFGDWGYMGYREAPDLRFIQDPYSVDGMIVLKYSFRAVYGILQAGALGYGAHP